MARQDPVAAAWARIEAWLAENAGDVLETLEPGASEATLLKAEQGIGRKLPADVRASYRRHDGADESDLFPALERDEMGYSLMPLSQVFRDWRLHSKPRRSDPGYTADDFDCDRGIRREYWNAGWIPLATNGGGDYHCVDLDPAPGGAAGQVIEWRHETNERRLVARSWERRLKELADGLEDGTFTYEEGSGIVRGRKRRAKKAASTAKRAAAAPAPAAPAKRPKHKLTSDQKRLLQLVRQAGPPVEPADDDLDDYPYTALVKALDPKLNHFGPCGRRQSQAFSYLPGFAAPLAAFYEHYEPRPGATFNGVRLLSVREMAQETVDLGVGRLTVMAVDDASGTRFAFDGSRWDGRLRPPVIRIPPGVNPPTPRNLHRGQKDKALAAAVGPDAAKHLEDFLAKLQSPKHQLVR